MWPGSQTTEFCQRSLGNRLQTHAMGSKPMISQEAFAFGTSGGSLDSSSLELRQEKRYRMTYHYKKAVIKGLEFNRSFSSSLTSFSDLKHCGEEVFTFVKLHAGDPWWKGHLIDVLRIIQISNRRERKYGIPYRPLRVPALAPTIENTAYWETKYRIDEYQPPSCLWTVRFTGMLVGQALLRAFSMWSIENKENKFRRTERQEVLSLPYGDCY